MNKMCKYIRSWSKFQIAQNGQEDLSLPSSPQLSPAGGDGDGAGFYVSPPRGSRTGSCSEGMFRRES